LATTRDADGGEFHHHGTLLGIGPPIGCLVSEEGDDSPLRSFFARPVFVTKLRYRTVIDRCGASESGQNGHVPNYSRPCTG